MSSAWVDEWTKVEPTYGGGSLVRCYANRGQRYRVGFEPDGSPNFVEVWYLRGADYGSTGREIWNYRRARMSTTAACAIRAAQAVVKERSNP